MVLRSDFNSSSLVRLLGGWLPAPVDAPRQDLAERLGQWLNVADAITLHGAHQALASAAPRARKPGDPTAGQRLAEECQRVRATLAKTATTRPAGAGDEPDTDYALYHQRYQDQQRRMAMSIDALRDHARKTLTAASPELAQLAALDAVLGDMLGPREQQLLAKVPAFLKKRFEQLRLQATAEAAATGAQAEPAPWLATFESEFQQALLAELDLRLQPVNGLQEAFTHFSNL